MHRPFLYSVEREFPYKIDVLWSAWTDANKLESWYHPTDLLAIKGASVSELKIGELWSCGVAVPAHNFAAYFYGTYTAIVKNSFIEHTMHYTQSPQEFEKKDMSTPAHLVTIDFENRGDKTWVRFTQFGELPSGEEKRAQAGMESYFDSLAIFLAR